MDKQYNQQYELMKAQNDWNLMMWNKNNEYNSPSAQVQRYIDAGLNPAMMMQNNNPVSATQMSSASPNVPGAPTPAGDFANAMIQTKQLELKNKELDIENKKADATIENMEADTKGKTIDNAWKDIINAQNYRTMEKTMQEVNQKIKLMDSEIQANFANINLTQAKTLTENLMRLPQVENVIAEYKKKYSDIGVNNATISSILTNIMLMNDEHNYNNTIRIPLGKQQIILTKQQGRKTAFEATESMFRGWELNLQYQHNKNLFGFHERAEKVERTIGAIGSAFSVGAQILQGIGLFNIGRGMTGSQPNSITNPIIQGNTGYQGTFGPSSVFQNKTF